jgi:membrane protein
VERERRCGRTLRCAQYCLQGERETQPRPRLLGIAPVHARSDCIHPRSRWIVLLPVVLDLFKLGTWSERLIAIARWPMLLIIAIAAISLVYRYGPSRRVAKWRWVSWGSVAAAISWIGMSMIFTWYVAQFDNRVYGSLGAIVGFMTWIWFSVVVVLVGAEVNAETELQTAVDSTRGRPRPLGRRGAVVADTIGEAQR